MEILIGCSGQRRLVTIRGLFFYRVMGREDDDDALYKGEMGHWHGLLVGLKKKK